MESVFLAATRSAPKHRADVVAALESKRPRRRRAPSRPDTSVSIDRTIVAVHRQKPNAKPMGQLSARSPPYAPRSKRDLAAALSLQIPTHSQAVWS